MIEIRKAEISDIEAIVNLHMKIFDDYFLTALGFNLLKRYYTIYFKNEDINLVAVDNQSNEIVGLIIITTNYENRMIQFYKKNLVYLLFTLLIKSLTLNKIVLNGLYARIYKAFKSKNKEMIEENVSLLSIGVDPLYRKKSIAKMMISSCEKILKTRGYKEYGLSVKKNNVVAINSYLKLGFNKIHENGELLWFSKSILLGDCNDEE